MEKLDPLDYGTQTFDHEQPHEEKKRRAHRPRQRYSPSPIPPKFVKEEKRPESSRNPSTVVREHRMQSTNVDGSGPGPSAPLRSPSQKPQQPSKRIVKPNSKYGYIPFSIPTTRTTTTNSSIADPPPQKKIRMMQLEVKKEVIEPDEVDPLSFPAPKRERGRPKKEQAVDLHEEDSEDDQADDEPQTEPVRKRGRPPRRAISSGPSTSGPSVAANVQEKEMQQKLIRDIVAIHFKVEEYLEKMIDEGKVVLPEKSFRIFL